MHNCNVAQNKQFRIKLTEKPEHSKQNPPLTLKVPNAS